MQCIDITVYNRMHASPLCHGINDRAKYGCFGRAQGWLTQGYIFCKIICFYCFLDVWDIIVGKKIEIKVREKNEKEIFHIKTH